VSRGLRRSLASLQVPNYRRWFTGLVISTTGTWMQTIAEAWLVLRLTGSGFALGMAAALQFAPMLLAAGYGGLLADRIPKRRLLVLTQALMAVPAALLWALTASGAVELWMVYALILARGTVLAVDNPARQAFVPELVGTDRLVNAVSLNSVLVQTARVTGPALAAAVIATAGVATCFGLNALSFGAMLIVLARLDGADLHVAPVAARAPGQLRAAAVLVWRTPELRMPLALMALVGALAFNFSTVLPLMAKFTFHGGASTYALLTSAMGAGAVLGALVNGARGRVSPALVAGSAFAFGAALGLVTLAPGLAVALALLPLVGAASVTFSAAVNTTLQLSVQPHLRGRVMAIYAMVFVGTTPIGGPLVGWLCEVAGPRAGLGVGAAAAILAGLIGGAALRDTTLSPATRFASMRA
jgi:MFS family permease